MAKKTGRKTCFVVGPIGADDSDDRIHADWLLEEIIQPVFAEHFQDFDVTRADKISDPGRIDAQVISSLLDSELVIADLTTLNPNAFYEIGIRHTVQKPIIHMHLEGQRIPFDIASFRSIKFERKRPKDLKAAREALTAAVTAALDEGHEVDNPVTFARGRVEFDKTATPSERLLQEQLEAIAQRLESIERPQNNRRMAVARALMSKKQDYLDILEFSHSKDKLIGITLFHVGGRIFGAPVSKDDISSKIDKMGLIIDYKIVEEGLDSVIFSVETQFVSPSIVRDIVSMLETNGYEVKVYAT